MKEGSPMEEQFLVEVLSDMAFTPETYGKVEHLVEYLLLFGFYKEAQNLYKEAFNFCKVTNKKVQTLGQISF